MNSHSRKRQTHIKNDSRTRLYIQVARKQCTRQALSSPTWHSPSKTHLAFTTALIHPSQLKANRVRTLDSVKIPPGRCSSQMDPTQNGKCEIHSLGAREGPGNESWASLCTNESATVGSRGCAPGRAGWARAAPSFHSLFSWRPKVGGSTAC